MTERITALYLRLSREDEGTGESESIHSQRELLTRFAAREGLSPTLEYVDDGWSGTGADRPALQRLLGDIKAGTVGTVLVKDLSRLGRNITLTSYLLDEFFPRHRVRLCAVGDDCDTARGDRLTHKMGVLTNLMNEWYSEDLSHKIRAALDSRRRAGEFLGSRPPYGYRRDPSDRHHLLPEPKTAAVVRHIFCLSAEGMSLRAIAKLLSAEGVPTPLATGKNSSSPWSPATVGKILRHPVYRGALAQGRSHRVSYKCRQVFSLPPEEWVVVEGCHEPLVSPALWERAQKGGGKKE